MKAAGFDYLPYPPPKRDARTVASTTGYGITIGALDPPPAEARTETAANPNDAITAGMNPNELAVYRIALYGPDVETRIDPPIESIGCLRRAQRELYGKDGEMTSGLVKLIDDVTAQAKASPEAQAATEAWARCMAAAGYDYADPDGAQDSIAKQFEAMTGGQGNGSADDRAALLDLYHLEVRLAKQDVSCATSSHLTEVVQAQIRQAEQAYIDSHPGIRAEVFGSG
ncbi:MAG: hypothetical protein QM733_21265 [Ilumatobacteraceae bacterium]